MTRMLALSMAATLILGVVGPACAEHTTGEVQTSVELGLGLRFARDGFSLDSRLNGPGGPWGIRLDGRLRPGGFGLEGRLQGGERGYDFRLDGSLSESSGQ
jgi:hypothetical protein